MPPSTIGNILVETVGGMEFVLPSIVSNPLVVVITRFFSGERGGAGTF